MPSLGGGQRRRVVYGRTKVEIVSKLNELKAKGAAGPLADPARETLAAYVGRWLRDVQSEKAASTTLVLQSGLLKNHIEPSSAAHVRMDHVTPEHVDRLLSDLLERGVSPRVRQQVFALVRVVLEHAVRRRRLAFNPAAIATRPQAPAAEVQALEARDAAKLLAAAEGDRLKALYVLALTTGMRQGELFGLQWRDVDLRKGIVTVRRTQREANGQIELGKPKTKKSRRSLALGGMARAALREHRRAVGAVPHPSTRVFTSAAGLPLRRSNFIRREWKPLVKRAGLAPIGFHAATRHTMASLAMAENLHPKIVQERLGHSRIDTTMDLYTHSGSELQQEAAKRLDEALAAAAGSDD